MSPFIKPLVKKKPFKYFGSLALKILMPIGVSLLLILFIGLYVYQSQQKKNLNQLIEKQVSSFSIELNQEIQQTQKSLETIQFFLNQNKKIRRAFESANQSLLTELSQPIFSKIEKNLNISHFYFTDAQRVNLLRVHAPKRHGDIINRATTLAAAAENRMVTGVELGVLGTLTIRSVSPWYDTYHKKIGYVELGVDISRLLKQRANKSDLNVFLAINKEKLNQYEWEQSRQAFGGKARWEAFENYAISSETWLKRAQINTLPNLDSIENIKDKLETTTVTGKVLYWKAVPIERFGGPNTGYIFIATDVTDSLDNTITIIYRTIAVFLLISLVLLSVVYRYTRRAMIVEDELNASTIKFQHLASYDQLTQLPNRKLFLDEFEQRLSESSRFQHEFALCFIDLDDFKVINDTMGHGLGDELLILLSQRLMESIREYDVLSRYGGDEFVLMMPQTSASCAASIISKLLSLAEKPFYLGKNDIYISLSIGISMYPTDGTDHEQLLRHADTAMYKAKNEGKNCFRFFTESMNADLLRARSIEAKLRLAVKNKELTLHYQPQFNLSNNKLCGYEALLRWFPQNEAAISPAEFIPIAEKTSLIKDLGDWVLNEACYQRKRWKGTGHDVRIDINISGSQLRFNSIYDLITENIKQHDLCYEDIGIELTENSLIDADKETIDSMNKLAAAGCSIAVDDFGTGYSSLSYLKSFPINIVKIDQSFVRDAHHDAEDRAIMKAITSMSHSLNLAVIVEGVETPQQESIAKEINCDIGQGYYYAKPKSAADIMG